MRKYFLPIIILLSLLSIVSCRDLDNSQGELVLNDDVKTLDLSKSIGGELSEFIEEVVITQLDTALSALVALPSEVVFDEEGVYILDTHKSRAIYSFDLNGKLRYKIDRYGRGPGEYTFLTRITISGDSLICWAADKNHLMFFDKNTGDLISEKRGLEDYLVRGLGVIEGGDLIVANDQHGNLGKPHSLYVLDKDLNIKQVLKDSSGKSSPFVMSSLPVSKPGSSSVLYKNVLHDTVYEITSQGILPKYRVVIPESMSLSSEDLLMSDDELFKKIVEQNLFSMSYSTLNTRSHLSVGLVKGQDFKQGMLYSKGSRKALDYSRLVNDVFEFDLPIPVATYQDYMVFVIEPEEVGELDTVFKEGAESFVLPNSSRTIKGNLGLMFIKFNF